MKNEEERIKTLKMYEMFKRELIVFQIPNKLPKCYYESIAEIKRRVRFKKFFTLIIDKLKSVCDYENEKRKVFIEKNGLYIPKSMFPELSNQAPTIRVFPKELSKDEFPDTILDKNDKFINGVDSNLFYFQNLFSDMIQSIDTKESDQ